MTQWLGARATNPNNQSSIPQIHMVEGEDFMLSSSMYHGRLHTRKTGVQMF